MKNEKGMKPPGVNLIDWQINLRDFSGRSGHRGIVEFVGNDFMVVYLRRETRLMAEEGRTGRLTGCFTWEGGRGDINMGLVRGI